MERAKTRKKSHTHTKALRNELIVIRNEKKSGDYLEISAKKSALSTRFGRRNLTREETFHWKPVNGRSFIKILSILK